MKSWIEKSLFGAVLFLLVIQLFPSKTTNPAVDSSRTIHSTLSVDPAVAATLTRACNDCHSNQTVWPWYSRVAPASWLVVSDVNRARKELNFSEWKLLSPERQKRILPEICKEFAEGEMPTPAYLLIHRQAKLSRAEIDAVCYWAHSAGVVPTEQASNIE